MRFGQILSLLCVLTGCHGSNSSTQTELLRQIRADQSGTQQRVASLEAKLEVLERQQFEVLAAAKYVQELERRLQAPSDAQPTQPGVPDPELVYAVDVADVASEGPKDALVTIVEASEFACPFCYRVRATIEQIKAHYGADVRIAYRHFVVHSDVATEPARAACAAHKQGKYSAMAELLWQAFNDNRNFSEENLSRLAKQAGLNHGRWQRDKAGDCVALIEKDQAELEALGVRGTPSFFINGRFLSGAQPFARFQAIIDEELALAKKRVGKDGVTAANYYQSWVLDRGRRSVIAR